MKLLTKELEKKFKDFPLGSQSGKYGLAKVIAKFFNPCGIGTWLITEGERTDDGDFEMFGYCHLGNDEDAELGYVRLSELEEIKGPLGIGIERDLYFEECTLEDAIYKNGFKVPTFLDTQERVKEILLDDEDLLWRVVNDINSWDGSLRDLDFYNLDKYELSCFYGQDLMQFADAILEGDFNSSDDYFRIDEWNTIITYSEKEVKDTLKDNIDDIVEKLFEEYENLSLNDCEELNDIMQEYFNALHPYAK